MREHATAYTHLRLYNEFLCSSGGAHEVNLNALMVEEVCAPFMMPPFAFELVQGSEALTLPRSAALPTAQGQSRTPVGHRAS